MSALSCQGLSVCRSGAQVLSDVSLTFQTGRLTAVIGPNGAGKSTLLGAVSGLLAPAGGTIRLGERALPDIDRRELARRRAFLPQRAVVEWPISVERAVALGLTPSLPTFGDFPPSLRPLVDKALSEYDLLDLRERRATDLSGGELARVMLARATVGDPEVLIVDEPTAGLDPRHAIDAVNRLRMRADAGRTVVMAIHDLALAISFADEIAALKHGRLVAIGPAEKVMTEAGLSELYDVRVKITRDADGPAIRFLDA